MKLAASLAGYQRSWLPGDLLAGLMLSAIAMPEQLATAKLAGFSPEAGLIAFGCAGLAYALLGRNPYLSVGADSTIAPIFAGGVAALVGAGGDPTVLAGAVALGAGLVLLIAGLARAGWIANLVSRPITIGFLAGIAVHIVVGQLPSLLGIDIRESWLPAEVVAIARALPHANLYALTIGLSVLIFALAVARVNERIPAPLIAVVGAGIAEAVWHLERHGVAVVGALHAQLPALRVPLPDRLDRVPDLVTLSVVVAVVCMMQTAAVIRAYPAAPDAPVDASRDFAAVGVGSILAGLLGSFAVDASPPRTALVAQSGGRSQLSTLVAIAVVVAVAAFFSDLAAYMPEAALAGVLIFIALRIVHVGEMAGVARVSGREFSLLLTCALLVIVLPIQQGMAVAIIISLAHGIFLEMKPNSATLVRLPNSTVWWPRTPETPGSEMPGVLVFAPSAPFNFTNADYVHQRLLDALAAEPQPTKLVVIEASGVTDFDYTGSQRMQRAIREFRARGIDVAIARMLSEHARRRAAASGLLAVLGESHLFRTVQDAVDALGPARHGRPGPEHSRMKVYNPPSLARGRGYSHAFEVPPNARVLYCAGQTGARSDGSIAADFRSQAEQAWRNVGAVLEAAGMSYADIVQVTHFLVNRADRDVYREVRAQFITHEPPSTMLIVAGLAQPDYLVEVEVVAAKP